MQKTQKQNKNLSEMTKSLPKTLSSNDFSQLDQFELFHYMVNHIGDELMLINSDGRIIYVNDATIRGLGFSRKQLIQQPITHFLKKKMTLKIWREKHYNAMKDKNGPINYRLDRVTKLGKTQTIDITAVYMEYKSQGYILSVARDVTAQIAMQNSLTEALDLYHSLCEGARDPIFIIDLKGQISYANPAAEKILDRSLWEIKGQNLKQFVPDDSFAKAWKVFQKNKKDAAPFQIEIDLINQKSSKIPFELAVSPIIKEKKIISFHIIARDITERREFEMLIRESEKMQAIQYFVLGSAQELKHPILMATKRIQNLLFKYKQKDFEYIGFKEFSNIIRSLEIINNQMKYCYDTTNRLLNLNQKKVGLQKNYCQANSIIREIVELKKEDFRESSTVKFKLFLARQLPLITIGKADFQQIMTNLITNGIQSMPGGGTVSIQTKLTTNHQQVEIQIKDQGVGIPINNLHHIFEPFFTTKQRGIGRNSGLGLPIVYTLVKACHGDIKVCSNLRKGTIFTITMPIAKKSSLKKTKK